MKRFVFLGLIGIAGYLGGSLGAYIYSLDERLGVSERNILLLDARDSYGPACKLYADIVSAETAEIIWNSSIAQAECRIITKQADLDVQLPLLSEADLEKFVLWFNSIKPDGDL